MHELLVRNCNVSKIVLNLKPLKIKIKIHKMVSLAACECNQNKNFMKITRRILRDTLDPFDIPDERFARRFQ